MQYEVTRLKVLICGNIGAGKSFLAGKLGESFPDFQLLAIDDFRRQHGDGSIEKEAEVKDKFFRSIIPGKPQILEIMGFGDVGMRMAELLGPLTEKKIILLLKTPIKTCLERLESREWTVPYPAPREKAIVLARTTEILITDGMLNAIWSDSLNAEITECKTISQETINNITNHIKSHFHETT